MFRGVFFDLDDTLVGYDAAHRGALAAVWRAAFGDRHPVERETLDAAAREIYLTRFGYGTPGYSTLGHCSIEALTQAIAAELLPRLGVEADANTLARAWSEAGFRLLATLPGASETLSALRRAGLKVGLITNGPGAFQRAKLAAVALSDAFDPVVIDTEFGHPKPDRRIFDHAAAAAGLTATELLFVGNSLDADVAGARAADWTAVWYNPGGEPLPTGAPTPDHTIRALPELLEIVGLKE